MSDNFGGMTPPPPPPQFGYDAPVQPQSGGSPWLKVLACGCIFLVIAVGLLGWFGYKFYTEKAHELGRQGLLQQQVLVRPYVEQAAPDRLADLDLAFKNAALAYQNRAIDREIGLAAIAVVVNRTQNALIDKTLSTEEVDSIIAVLRDIGEDPAGFNLSKYPELQDPKKK